MRMRNVFICLVTLCLFRATSSSSSSSSSINDRRNQLKRQRTSALLPPTAAVANRPLKSIKASRALQRDVEELVKACLRDPGINLIGVPDFLEKQVYRATIQLTLEALYNGLESIHGKELLGHVFVVQRRSRRRMRIQRDIARISDLADANDQVLEKVADKLLQNKFVNQPLIPDVIERALYANCLKIIFRVLDLLAVSFRITICGHDIRIHLEPSTRDAVQESALQRVAGMGVGASSSGGLASIDMVQIKDVARRMANETMETQKCGWFRRWFHSMSNEFITQMHVTVYCLVLGVLDDLLENTEVQLLSDRVRFDLVPLEPDVSELSDHGAVQIICTETSTRVPVQVVYRRVNPIVPLSIGIVVGYLMRQLVLSRHVVVAARYCRSLWYTFFKKRVPT